MPVKKKAAKKNAKPRMKTATTSDFYSSEVYNGTVNCPYCGKRNSFYDEEDLPESTECHHCDKEFKIKWDI